MTDVLLIQPPIRDFYLTAKRTVPYGLASIAASLQAQGFSVRICDALATRRRRNLSPPAAFDEVAPLYPGPDISPFALFHTFHHYGSSFESIGRTARTSRAFLVGIASLCTAYADEALQTAAMVKQWHPECHVVLGGHHPTAMPEAVLSHPAVDSIVRGEGEVALPLLAEALRHGRSLQGIPGLIPRDGAVEGDPLTSAVMDVLDDFPPPAHHLIDYAFYRRKGRPSSVVVSSRGCPLRCSYCGMGRRAGLPFRQRAVSAVVSEIESLVTRHGVGFIDFEDENLIWEPRRFLDLLGGLRRRVGRMNLELRAMNGLLPTHLDAQVINAMSRSGFRTLNLALGSSSGVQLRRFRRPDVRAAFDQALALAARNALDAVGYVIAGAPLQQPTDSVEDLLYLARRRVLAGVSLFYPSPGSADFERCRRLGQLPGATAGYRASALPVVYPTSRTAAVTILRLGRVLNFIKALIDAGIALPRPRPFRPQGPSPPRNRTETGRKLLAWFFHDGRIRGATARGDILVHPTDRDLCRQFLEGLQAAPVLGHHRV